MNPSKRKHLIIRIITAAIFITSLGTLVGSVYALVKMQQIQINSQPQEVIREQYYKETAEYQINQLFYDYGRETDEELVEDLKRNEQREISPNHFFKIYNSENQLIYSKESASKGGFITQYPISTYQRVDKLDQKGRYVNSELIEKHYTVESQILSGAHDQFWYIDALVNNLAEINYNYYGILIVSAFLNLASLIGFSMHSGVRDEDGEVQLNAFDHLPLELFLTLLVSVVFIVMGFLVISTNEFHRDVHNAFLMGLITSVIGLGISFVFYDSLIKRIKTKQLFKNSLMNRWICLPVMRLIKTSIWHRDLVLKAGSVISASIIFDIFTFRSISNGNGGMVFIWVIKTGVITWFAIKLCIEARIVRQATHAMVQGEIDDKIETSNLHGPLKEHAQDLNQLSDGIRLAVDKQMKSERMKTELITNVSHDIKTPLTSIINYVGLLEQKTFEDPEIQEYLQVLTRQSGRLKKLIEDLVDASKASSGSIQLNREKTSLNVLLEQVVGEYTDRFDTKKLDLIITEDEVSAYLDGNVLFRILDNLLGNVYKYSLDHSRVYVSLKQTVDEAQIEIKNISQASLNISSDELMERFVRGDASRNTEGSGLGLSIAKALTEVMDGAFVLEIDGDLFKVKLSFPLQ